MSPPAQRRLVVVGSPGDERIVRLDEAARAAGLEAPIVVGYDDLLSRPETLASALDRPGYLRLELPGSNVSSWLALLAAGADILAAEGTEPLEPRRAAALVAERSLFWRADLAAMHRQAYLGLVRLAADAAAVAEGRDTILLNDPTAIALVCDKARCHERMVAEGVSVPRALPVGAAGFDALLDAMGAARLDRVFVKPRYGSAAAGMVALARSRHGLAAWSPATIQRSAGTDAVHACTRVQRFADRADIAVLVEAVLTSGAHVEAWVPKAGHEGRTCDLRLLVIAGEPRHLVLRQAEGPITNLHLGARRGAPEPLLERLDPAVWPAVQSQAVRFAKLFPRALHLAFDIAVEASLRRHRFLEANVFGDLLRRTLHRGQDPLGAELAALSAWPAARRLCA